ncbi:MAG: LLM class flavin-dependent oxidoreductase [Microthrixaceae bacterium]
MRLSIWPTAQQPWEDILEVVTYADDAGWYSAYVWDHFMGDGAGFGAETVPTLESTALLAALGALTTSIRLGSMVLGNTHRHPAVVANWAATVDLITGGRFTLGLGAGWQTNEHRMYGIDLPPAGERRRRLDESCAVIRTLLINDRSTFDGEFYQLDGALCEPKPIQDRLPLLIGAKGDLMLRVVAKHADRWNMWSLPEQFRERSRVLDIECERIGRDPSEIARTTQALVFLTEDPTEARRLVDSVAPRAAIAGPATVFAETVAQWAAFGVDEVIVTDMNMGRGSRRLETLATLHDAVASMLD